MKKIIGVSLVLLVFISIFCASVLNSVSADENYIDNSYEYGAGSGDPEVPPENYQSRDEPRTRNKDA